MANLTRAHDELFNRDPDERFANFDQLWEHCSRQRSHSIERWYAPEQLKPAANGRLGLSLGEDGDHRLNDWSFSQLCRTAGVSKDTVNRLSPDTAARVFDETLPQSGKPFQLLTADSLVRSVHAASYTRLDNVELLSVIREFATDFEPPQTAAGGGNGLYCGEQDMFVFLIDPLGWTEIRGEAFAPGFFVWNSEVGRRSVGIQSFWFQAVCANHIVWDAIEVQQFTRKHTRNVNDALGEIRRHLEALVAKRDERRDGFAKVIDRAMTESLGGDKLEVQQKLQQRGFRRSLTEQALKLAEANGGLTVFSVVDALTRIAGKEANAGARTEADSLAGALLSVVS